MIANLHCITVSKHFDMHVMIWKPFALRELYFFENLVLVSACEKSREHIYTDQLGKGIGEENFEEL